MTYDEIDKFMLHKSPGSKPVRISFKTRNAIKGIFIKLPDYDELRKKNLWRIVSESHIESYKASNDSNLARIFNGTEMTRLELIH